MGVLTPARPTASRAGAVTPITGHAATAPGLPFRHTLISTRTDRSDRWVAAAYSRTSIFEWGGSLSSFVGRDRRCSRATKRPVSRRSHSRPVGNETRPQPQCARLTVRASLGEQRVTLTTMFQIADIGGAG